MEPQIPREAQTEAQPGRARDAPDNKTKVMLIGACLLVALLLLGLAFWAWRSNHKPAPGLAYEANVVVGELPGKTPEERQAELDQVVDEGMLSLSINATPSGVLSQDGGKVNWLIENPANQGKLIRVEIYLTGTDTKIYETGALRPGTYVEAAPLAEALEAGEYDCTAVFYTYRLETEEFIGQAAAEITLTLAA